MLTGQTDPIKPTCWFIGEAEPAGSVAERLVRSHRFLVQRSELWADGLTEPAAAPGNLICLRFDVLRGLPSSALRGLARCVAQGATLYLNDIPGPGTVDLWPLADAAFVVFPIRRAHAYRFPDNPLTPRVLVGEQVGGDFALASMVLTRGRIEPLIVASHSAYGERPIVFAVRCGDGIIICDLSGTPIGASAAPIIRLLADRASRLACIGFLIAIRAARDSSDARASSFCLMLDDRPINLDYFGTPRLRRFLEHVERRCSQAHIDLAWTPAYDRPVRSYIETLKAFNTGFVWHGLLRHVDHGLVTAPAKEFEQGKRLVEGISRRYGVRFQPVMVFPYERETPDSVSLLSREGFLAKVRTVAIGGDLAAVSQAASREGILEIERYAGDAINRDWMMALAALGLPIIAFCHPRDVNLRRFNRRGHAPGSVTFFDTILDFAAEKALAPCSLEEIALESGSDPIRRLARELTRGEQRPNEMRAASAAEAARAIGMRRRGARSRSAAHR